MDATLGHERCGPAPGATLGSSSICPRGKRPVKRAVGGFRGETLGIFGGSTRTWRVAWRPSIAPRKCPCLHALSVCSRVVRPHIGSGLISGLRSMGLNSWIGLEQDWRTCPVLAISGSADVCFEVDVRQGVCPCSFACDSSIPSMCLHIFYFGSSQPYMQCVTYSLTGAASLEYSVTQSSSRH